MSEDKKIFTTPNVRKFARELGANISEIKGTQRKGRVSHEDVKNFINDQLNQRKKIIFWGIGAAIVLRIIFTLITAYLLQITGLRLIGGILLLYICYKLYVDVVKTNNEDKKEVIEGVMAAMAF